MRTIFARFAAYAQAAQAVDELFGQGFDEESINVIVAEEVVQEYADIDQNVSGGKNLDGLLAGHQAISVSNVGPVIVVGKLSPVLDQAGVEADPTSGGLVAAFKELDVPEETAAVYTDGIYRSNLVLAIRTDDERAAQASEILSRANGRDLSEVGG